MSSACRVSGCDCEVFKKHMWNKKKCSGCFHELVSHGEGPMDSDDGSLAAMLEEAGSLRIGRGRARAETVTQGCQECTCTGYKPHMWKENTCRVCFHPPESHGYSYSSRPKAKASQVNNSTSRGVIWGRGTEQGASSTENSSSALSSGHMGSSLANRRPRGKQITTTQKDDAESEESEQKGKGKADVFSGSRSRFANTGASTAPKRSRVTQVVTEEDTSPQENEDSQLEESETVTMSQESETQAQKEREEEEEPSLDVQTQETQVTQEAQETQETAAQETQEEQETAMETEEDPEVVAKRAKRAENRKRVVQEILATERQYVDHLNFVVHHFYARMTQIAERSDLNVIFSNVENILNVNESLLGDLAHCVEAEGGATLSRLFLEFAPFLKLYTQYVNNYQAGMERLTAMKEDSKKFRKAMEAIETDPKCGGKNLSSYLIMPIQRIPRYELLLRDLLKQTEDDHEDRAGLEEALLLVQEVATAVNESKRRNENLARIHEVQDKLTGKYVTLVDPQRQFVREGKLRKRPKAGKRGRTHDRYFFLFNDLLVYTAPHSLKDGYEFKGMIPLHLASVKDEEGNCFSIIAQETSMYIEAADEESKREWFSAIEGCCKEIQRKMLHRASMEVKTRSLNLVLSERSDSVSSLDELIQSSEPSNSR